MKTLKTTLCALTLATSLFAMQSCTDGDDSMDLYRPTALVTVRPLSDGDFVLQLDESTVLNPVNLEKSPFGDKEVRALVNYTETSARGASRDVHINWIDSIRTKMPVPDLGDENDERYGNDPIEIVKDWVTIAEDGYLTLRIRTEWGSGHTKHYINLLSGVNPDNPYEFELRHDANDDMGGNPGDALIAFNLNNLPREDGQEVTIKLNWQSFDGRKSAEFNLNFRESQQIGDAEKIAYNRLVK